MQGGIAVLNDDRVDGGEVIQNLEQTEVVGVAGIHDLVVKGNAAGELDDGFFAEDLHARTFVDAALAPESAHDVCEAEFVFRKIVEVLLAGFGHFGRRREDDLLCEAVDARNVETAGGDIEANDRIDAAGVDGLFGIERRFRCVGIPCAGDVVRVDDEIADIEFFFAVDVEIRPSPITESGKRLNSDHDRWREKNH